MLDFPVSLAHKTTSVFLENEESDFKLLDLYLYDILLQSYQLAEFKVNSSNLFLRDLLSENDGMICSGFMVLWYSSTPGVHLLLERNRFHGTCYLGYLCMSWLLAMPH